MKLLNVFSNSKRYEYDKDMKKFISKVNKLKYKQGLSYIVISTDSGEEKYIEFPIEDTYLDLNDLLNLYLL